MVSWQTLEEWQVLLECTAKESESLVVIFLVLYALITKESSCLGLQL
jgi:hypothetical protein